MLQKGLKIDLHLFCETKHSPSLTDIIGEELVNEVHDFCFIENPYYPNKSLFRKLQNKLPQLLKSYPSSNPKLAQKSLASVIHVNPEHLIIGNGATELIAIIQNQLVDNMGIPIPTFSEYIEKFTHTKGLKLFQLQPKNRYQLDLNDFSHWLHAEKLSAALVINPGNPTGQLFRVDELIEFLKSVSHLKLIIVDESFIDFAGEDIPTIMPHISEFKNLMVVRSMSKHCGIPGLRLGYCCTSNIDFLQIIRKMLPVWNINTLAEYFLTQLKETETDYHNARMNVIADVKNLYQKLSEIPGFETYPTGSNFILIKIKNGLTAFELQMKLLQEFGIYVRDCSNKAGLDKFHVRVASKGKEKDKKLVAALKQISLSPAQ